MSEAGLLYKMSQRRLVSTLMYAGENANEVFEIVSPSDIEEPALELILTAMVNLTRRNETISTVSVARELENSGNLEKSGGISELHALHSEGEKYSLEAPVEIYAEILQDAASKSRINRELEEARKDFKDDSGKSTVDAVSELQSVLNQQLVGLSSEKTITRVQKNVHNYEDVLQMRREISEANKEQADGLQGIPSLLPTLNKYTHGWSPSQMITVGARTGVGKALAIDTPILTNDGWKTMEEIKVGNFVYGRDGKLAKVTNATEIQFNRKTYRVTFNNGETIIADADHLWLVEDIWSRLDETNEQIKTTEELLENIYYTDDSGNRTINYSVKISKSLISDDVDFDIDPLLCGTAIAKGSFSDEYLKVVESNTSSFFDIVKSYVNGSSAQKQQFIKGLLSDNADELPYICLSDYEIAESVRSIFASLGYLTFLEYDEKDYAYQVSFYPPNEFTGIIGYHSVYIVDIELVDSVPVKCIEVDNEDHVYLAGNALIPTHNSVFAVNNAVAAARAGKSVLFFTLEMSNEEIDDRIIASMSGVSMSKLKEGNLTEDDMVLVRKALDELKDMKVTVDSDPRVTVDTIRARAFKQAQSPDGLDLIIVDYLQLIAPVGKFSSRQEAVADISRNMKLTAKTLEVPIIVLVQLNRAKGDDDEENKLPSLDNIRESGSIAMDSDVVILLHRDDNFDDTTPHTLVILDKNRNGESHKVIRCHSNLECSVFREVKREKDVSEERMTEEEMSELEADIDLEDFDGYDLDDNDLDL